MRLLEIALPLPLFQTFVYAAPAGMNVPRGSRVVVPVRNRTEIGIVVGEAPPGRAPKRVRRITAAPDEEPAVTAELFQLCQWIADYYVAPLGMVLRAVLPVALAAPDMPVPRPKTRSVVRLRTEAPSLLERDALFGRARRQREAYEVIESLGGTADAEHLRARLAVSPAVIRRLAERGLIEVVQQTVARDPFALRPIPPDAAPGPTAAQARAIAMLTDAQPGEVFLLHGVTGSGKTLVYIELLKEVVLRRGLTGIVLVPEIALTPQTVDRFRAVFGDSIAVLHSALGEGERYDAWQALRRGEKRIAVGARSAVFAPLPRLGAVIVDEEHEPSYKQGEAPRYHAREAAIMRARESGATVVLGSATPSLESWHNAATGKFRLLELPERVGGGRLPSVAVVDLRRQPAQSAESRRGRTDYERVISAPLDAALAVRLELREQSVLLLNRRGYSAFVQCTECGAVVTCPNCSITLTHHRTPHRLLCHYCGHQEPGTSECPRCGGQTLRQRGLGTQQVERLLGERFPHARIARMDVDTTSGKWSHARILDSVAAGDVDMLLGTQMIAKGLDFPNVTLVGVVDADVGINLPDFRASERAYQLISQVAGRAGRGPRGGEVFIQTRVPDHHAVLHALRHDYHAFAAAELESRRDPAYPPYVRLANIVLSGTEQGPTADLALAAARWLRRLIERSRSTEVTLVGAAPSAIERIQSRWRWHLLLKSASPGSLTGILRYFSEHFAAPPKSQLRITVDRDPVTLL
ncbi:MAG TPA: primosomal protein N' [Gemmatimonadaceae bacterium]|nr:primosomal protein N' [Gemmatimonadaceae bacterium]